MWVVKPRRALLLLELRAHPSGWGFPGDPEVKASAAMRETWVLSLGREDPLEKEMQPTPVFWPGESHGRRSLVGYSPRGREVSDTTSLSLSPRVNGAQLLDRQFIFIQSLQLIKINEKKKSGKKKAILIYLFLI